MSEQAAEIAGRLLAAGISVIPIRPDGSKAPALPKDHPVLNRHRPPSESEIRDWWLGRVRGIAALGGRISGDLECLDFDEVGLFGRWADDVDMALPGMLQRLVIIRTPRGGHHAWWRCPECEANQIIARRPATDDELRQKPKTPWYKTVETRGHGGYALVPGSPRECHAAMRAYEYDPLGLPDLAQVQTIAAEERDVLLGLARALNTYAEPPRIRTNSNPTGTLTPGDDFERRGSWQEVLEQAGWTLERGDWQQGRLTRPGKSDGVSATLGVCRGPNDEPLLHVFSTGAGIEPGTYGLFRAFAAIHCNGDLSAAARALAGRGYGEKRRPSANGHHPTGVPGPDGEYELSTQPLRGLKARPVHWLVDRRIPLGKLVMVAGIGGMGKSTLVRHLIACITTGRPAFGLDYETPPASDVLLASIEDGAEDTILPHLLAEGADISRVHLIRGVQKPDGQLVQFELRDMELVLRHLKARPEIKLLVIDPIMSFIGRAGLNENVSGEVRTVLDPLLDLAEQSGLTVLLIAHFNKATGSAAVMRVAGSSAFRDSCRVVYGVGNDPNEPEHRVLALTKANIPGIERGSLAFGIEKLHGEELRIVLEEPEFGDLGSEDRSLIAEQLFRLRHLGPIDCDADSAMGSHTGGGAGRSRSQKAACADWLLDRLGTEYSWLDQQIADEAEAKGWSLDVYKRAKATLPELQRKRVGFKGNYRIAFGDPATMPHGEAPPVEAGAMDEPDIWPN